MKGQGLRYNPRKSEVIVFNSKNKTYAYVPTLYVCGKVKGSRKIRVVRFKYLGHWISEDLKDGIDIERERRVLILARRFARCSKQVKVKLSRTYCQNFYSCSLWGKYSSHKFNALCVQYNDTFRILIGLPHHCSASGMFTEGHIDGFHAIIKAV